MNTLNETLKEIQTKCFELLKLTGKAKKECLGIFDDAKREESEMAKMDLEDANSANRKNADEDDGAFDDHDIPAEPCPACNGEGGQWNGDVHAVEVCGCQK